MTYDLTLAALCADFRENIDFQFSLGWTALVTRFIGATNAKRALSGGERGLKVSSLSGGKDFLMKQPAQRMLLCPQEGPAFKDEVLVSVATGLVSVTSRASMVVLVIGGVVSSKPSR